MPAEPDAFQPVLLQLAQLHQQSRSTQPQFWGGGIWIIGAGSSKSAGIPLARGIAQAMALDIARKQGYPAATPDQALAALVHSKTLPPDTDWSSAYSRIFSKVLISPTDQKQTLLRCCPPHPFATNLAHIVLSDLIFNRMVPARASGWLAGP